MYTKDKTEKKQMFMDFVQCKIWELIKVDEEYVILKREGTENILKCPRKKFNNLFTPIEV